jgi:branched-chain amino acid transport system permease protein
VQQFIAQTLNGLTLAGIIFLVSSGFTLVFGVMRVTNLSHGAVYLLGGYVGYSVITATHNFFYGLAAGTLAMGALGLILERTLITWLGRREMAELLATLGLIYVLDDISLAIWGGTPLTINLPGVLGRSTTLPISGIVYPIRGSSSSAYPSWSPSACTSCSAGPGSGRSSGRAWTTARW